MNCFIIDDDSTTRFLIEDMIGKIDGIEVTGSFENPLAAMQSYLDQKPELILLDVEMPEINGVEFASTIDKSTKIIFISSKKEYAVDAFGLNAVDYILKPVTLPRLTKSVLRLLNETKNNIEDDHFFLKTSDGYDRVITGDICYVEALGDYVQIFTEDSKYVMNGTLKTVISKFPESKFARVHRSYIVNLSKIEKLEDGVIIIGSKLIPVGRSYKKEFTDRINTLDL